MLIIENNKVSPSSPPYIIAELSANHNGSLERAKYSIKVAKDCGANAIKIQSYSPDTMTIDCKKEDFVIKGGLWNGYKLYDLYKEAHMPFDWHEELFNYARSIGITIFSTPFDESAVDILEGLEVPAYKIASFELTDLSLINYIAKKKKPMLISTGMASYDEIAEAIETAKSGGCNSLLLFHCISSYPAPIEQMNLKQISNLQKQFNVCVGLSDHSVGNLAAISAVSLGACAIEKHFTVSRKDKSPDSEFSIEPFELKKLVNDTKKTWLSLQGEAFIRSKAESDNKVFRRSIYFVADIKAGGIINSENIRRIRPGFGISPKFFNNLIGKKVICDVERGEPVTWDLIEKD